MATLPQLQPKEVHYFNRIDKFFRHCDPAYITKMIDIIDGNSHISLRILDWFVTRYTCKKTILLDINDETIDIHIDYKANLKSFKKKYFDPFKRSFKMRPKFNYTFKQINKTICTTIGQLNFFSWAISIGIIKYVEDNYNIIIKEMNVSNKNDKKRKKEKQVNKLTQTSKQTIDIGIAKKINNEQMSIVITFD